MVRRRRKTSKDIFIIAVLTTLTVFTWIGLDVYRSFKKSTVPQALNEQLRSLNPNFDAKTIEVLETRLKISEKELENLPPRELTLVEEAEVKTEISSPSAEITLPERASPGAQLKQ